jgi:hypothetical protein
MISLNLFLFDDSLFQIFEDGAAYRGRLKTMGRDIIKIHFQAELNPDIEHCHNSNQRDEAIAGNVKKLIDKIPFPPGATRSQCKFFVMINQPQ